MRADDVHDAREGGVHDVAHLLPREARDGGARGGGAGRGRGGGPLVGGGGGGGGEALDRGAAALAARGGAVRRAGETDVADDVHEEDRGEEGVLARGRGRGGVGREALEDEVGDERRELPRAVHRARRRGAPPPGRVGASQNGRRLGEKPNDLTDRPRRIGPRVPDAAARGPRKWTRSRTRAPRRARRHARADRRMRRRAPTATPSTPRAGVARLGRDERRAGQKTQKRVVVAETRLDTRLETLRALPLRR